MTIRQKITAACIASGITQTELAKRLGMRQQTLSKRLQTGKFTDNELNTMAQILGCK